MASGQPLLLRQQIAIRPGRVAAELPRLHLHVAVGEYESHLLCLQLPDLHQFGGNGGALRLLHRCEHEKGDISGGIGPNDTQLSHL